MGTIKFLQAKFMQLDQDIAILKEKKDKAEKPANLYRQAHSELMDLIASHLGSRVERWEAAAEKVHFVSGKMMEKLTDDNEQLKNNNGKLAQSARKASGLQGSTGDKPSVVEDRILEKILWF